MYEENEQDWEVLKKYKQKKRDRLNNRIKELNRLVKKFQKEQKTLAEEVTALNAEEYHPLNLIDNSKRYVARRKKNDRLSDLHDDIAKAKSDIAEAESLVAKLRTEIEEIEAKIKEIRAKRHAKVKAHKDSGSKKELVEPCPKKCKISNITIACSHNRTMEVPPYEEGGDIPTLHVVSGSNEANKDLVTVKMGGSCDHGKTQSAGDNKDYKVTQRLVGSDQYCPTSRIQGHNNDVRVERPNGVQFNAATNLKLANTSPVYVLLKRLVFGGTDDTTEYDISFGSCKGNHPYKAKVVAHPKEVWDLKFSFGYKSDYSSHTAKRKYGHNKVQSYDAMLCSGKWEAVVEGSYTYDSVKSTPVKLTLGYEELVKELQGRWAYLAALIKFFEPLNAFFESAIGYSEGAEKQFKKRTADAVKRGRNIGGVEEDTSKLKVKFEGPTIKIGGNFSSAERKELTTEVDGRKLTAPLFDVGGKGELSVAFDPLLKITGTIDILQLILCTLGGPLGAFLRKVSNMSMGKRDDDNKLIKTESYIETNLTLNVGLTSSLAGSLVFECAEEKGWDASEKTNIGGFLGFVLEGKAAVDGRAKGICFNVVFGAGAEFKTTSEAGDKESGIEVNYKPTMVGNKFNWAGEFIFNGLSIIWVVYANGGVDGAEGGDKASSKGKKAGRGLVDDVNVETKKEMSDKYDLFKKRPLFKNDDVGKVDA